MKRFLIVSVVSLSALGKPLVERSYTLPADPTSPWSSSFTVTLLEGTPPAPTSLAVIDAYNGREARITWECPASPLITGFEIERQQLTLPPDGWGSAVQIIVPSPVAREYLDQAGPGTFRYRVRSLNDRIPPA